MFVGTSFVGIVDSKKILVRLKDCPFFIPHFCLLYFLNMDNCGLLQKLLHDQTFVALKSDIACEAACGL